VKECSLVPRMDWKEACEGLGNTEHRSSWMNLFIKVMRLLVVNDIRLHMCDARLVTIIVASNIINGKHE
jgi:hypothetical protein